MALTIGRLAKNANVTVATVRHYEKLNLPPKPSRSNSGYRNYSVSDLEVLEFITKVKELGFSLKEIATLQKINEAPKAECDAIKKTTNEKINTIKQQIKKLTALKNSLARLHDQCPGSGPLKNCPIMAAICSKK